METRIDHRGYLILKVNDRRRRNIYEHILIAENMFSGALPSEMVVHHLDCDQQNNNPVNLMVCSQGYHKEQHKRIDSFKATGLSWYKKCQYCGEYSNPKEMYVRPNNGQGSHKECKRLASEKSRNRNKDGINKRRREKRKALAACEAFMEVEL